MTTKPHSLIIPVYRNEGSLSSLLSTVTALNQWLQGALEVVFVVDGSPDNSYAILRRELEQGEFQAQLLLLSRNFGSFAAIREGLRHARGEVFAVTAADLQEPPELVREFFRVLRNEPYDVAVGTRDERNDPLLDRLAAKSFWGLYRRLVQREMPSGGFDIFACNRLFRDHLLRFTEVNTSLVGQVLWLGFRRKEISYVRRKREHGKSAWTFRKKINYLFDSVFAFTDFPIKALLAIGAFGLVLSVLIGMVVSIARLAGDIPVPGYTATVLLIVFFSALNLFALGVIGSYAWRAYEDTKGRPQAIVMQAHEFLGKGEQQ